MKFKVGIIDADTLYLERLVQWFSSGYADKLEIFSFTKLESFQEALEDTRFDIVLAAEEIKFPKQLISSKVGFAYLGTQADVERMDDIPVIAKYQSIEMLYKQIIGLYANNEDINIVKKNMQGNHCKVIMVTSASGGVGTSTVAVACAKNIAMQGKKVLYLNLEKNAAQDLFFVNNGQGSLSDIIYLLKSNKNNIALRMESIVQKDSSGIYYFGSCKNILDRLELDAIAIERFLKEITAFSDYENIVIDTEFSFDDVAVFLTEFADVILMVSDGSKISCQKTKRFFDTLTILDEQKQLHALPKFGMIYNRFSSKNGYQAEGVEFPVFGGSPRYEGVEEIKIAEEIAALSFWEKCR